MVSKSFKARAQMACVIWVLKQTMLYKVESHELLQSQRVICQTLENTEKFVYIFTK